MINYEMALSEIEMYKKAHESLSKNLTHANKKAQQFKAERDKFEQVINEECERGYQMEGKYHDMKAERDTLIDDLSWYKAKVSRLEDEKERLKEIKQEKEQLEESFQYQLEKRLEYFNKYQELKKENAQLKEKNGKLQEVIEGKNSDLLFTEDENKQLKESRDWDYEYIIKVNEENKRLERENERLEDEKGDYKAKYITAKLHLKDVKDENILKNNLLSEISQHIGNKPSSSTYKYFRAKLDGIGIKERD